MTLRYQIRIGSEWQTVTKAVVTERGWLHYEIKTADDHVIGLAPPNKWREKPQTEKQK